MIWCLATSPVLAALPVAWWVNNRGRASHTSVPLHTPLHLLKWPLLLMLRGKYQHSSSRLQSFKYHVKENFRNPHPPTLLALSPLSPGLRAYVTSSEKFLIPWCKMHPSHNPWFNFITALIPLIFFLSCLLSITPRMDASWRQGPHLSFNDCTR